MDIVTSGTAFLASGRWATAKLKDCALQGKALSADMLRTLDTLRHDEWKAIDDAVIEEAKIRLVGVADLLGAGLVRPVANALGKTLFLYEKMNDLGPADVSLDGLARSKNDTVEFDDASIPLPIIHKDYFINLRRLAASRERGESLDTTQARLAGRVVAEKMEDLLFNGHPNAFGGKTIYGYRTEPNRNVSGFGSNGDWGQAAKTGENILADVQTMISTLHGDRMYGPYWIYVPADTASKLVGDFKANSDKTIIGRLQEIPGILGVKVADQLPVSNVVMVQATQDVTAWVSGESLQNIEWDEYGGFQVNFKAFAIGVPLVRSDITGRSGVYHMSD